MNSLNASAILRENYETIARQIGAEENPEDECLDETVLSRVNNVLDQADTLYTQVQELGDSKQLCNDAIVLNVAGKVILKQLTNLSMNNANKSLNPKLYATRMRRYAEEMSQREEKPVRNPNPLMLDDISDSDDDDEDNDRRNLDCDSSMSRKEWAFIGKNLGYLLHAPLGMTYLNPILKEDDLLPSQIKAKKLRARKDEQEERVVIRRNERVEENSEDLAASQELSIINSALKRSFNRCENDYLDYYSFVIDPKDFSKTVENMFYVSFLVKDALVKLELKDNLPALVKVNEQERRIIKENHKSSLISHQAILSYTLNEWESMKRVLNLKEAAIPSKKTR